MSLWMKSYAQCDHLNENCFVVYKWIRLASCDELANTSFAYDAIAALLVSPYKTVLINFFS